VYDSLEKTERLAEKGKEVARGKIVFFLNFNFLFWGVTYSFMHMCIHCLGHFSTLPPIPSLSPPLPSLPFSLILVKSRHKQ
jgi:hypothetical protein